MASQSPKTPRPFAPFEWMIAWRYLRARRAEGGVSVMTWISLIGITLAVFALIATLAVRSGFRAEFVDTILGANAHVTIYNLGEVTRSGQLDRNIDDYDDMAARIKAVPGVTRVAPWCVVKSWPIAQRATRASKSTGSPRPTWRPSRAWPTRKRSRRHRAL